MKIVANPHPRIRVTVDCSDAKIIERDEKENIYKWERPSSVDKAGARAADVNVIVATFAAQGIRPSDIPGRVGSFLDNTKIPSFLDAFNIIKEAKELFDDLPINVRRAMDHNPALMEEFLRDPQNKDLLLKEGILVPKVEPDPDDQPLDRKTFKKVMSEAKSAKEPTK